MKILVASLIVVSVLYFWDAGYNNGQLWNGLQSMGRSLGHSLGF
jgi:hypothetical protein